MKAILLLLIAMGVVVIVYTVGNSPKERDDRAEIQQLVDRYYDALRNGRYGEAAMCYESKAFEGTGLDAAQALKQATELSGGVPPKVIVDALRVLGDRATCELLIEREGQGPIKKVMEDSQGNVLGTWAKTLHFVREADAWKIAKDSDNTGKEDMKKALNLLQNIQRQQQEEKKKREGAGQTQTP